MSSVGEVLLPECRKSWCTDGELLSLYNWQLQLAIMPDQGRLLTDGNYAQWLRSFHVRAIHKRPSYAPEIQLMTSVWSLVHACVAIVAALGGEKAIICWHKVGQPWITNLRVMWTDGWVMSKCTQDSQKVCTKLLSLPDKAQKTQFLVPQLNYKFALSPRLHPQSDHIINTRTTIKTLRMDLSWDHFNSSLQAKTHIWPQEQ